MTTLWRVGTSKITLVGVDMIPATSNLRQAGLQGNET